MQGRLPGAAGAIQARRSRLVVALKRMLVNLPNPTSTPRRGES
jgi:hypothetical protein